MKEVTIGIDIGGTNTVFGIIDHEGKTLAEGSLKTAQYSEISSFIKALHEKIQESINGLNHQIILKGIGAGAPNGNYYHGTIEYAPNLVWKGIIPIVNLLKEYYQDIPVILTNDANAAAMGELIYGNGKELKNFIVITLGTGLGSGIIVNGELVYGHDGFAGELGHTNVVKNGRLCGCGRHGCLETYVSATGIRRTVFELLANEPINSELRNISYNQLTAKMVTEAAQNGDRVALKAYEITGELLGFKLADVVALLSPETIFLFGGLANAGDFIFTPTRHHFEKNVLNIFKNKVQILPSGLQEQNIAILGASALVWKELTIKKIESVV